jgi:hypothetical protein
MRESSEHSSGGSSSGKPGVRFAQFRKLVVERLAADRQQQTECRYFVAISLREADSLLRLLHWGEQATCSCLRHCLLNRRACRAQPLRCCRTLSAA